MLRQPEYLATIGALSLEAIAGYGRQATGSKYVIIPSRAA